MCVFKRLTIYFKVCSSGRIVIVAPLSDRPFPFAVAKVVQNKPFVKCHPLKPR